MAEILQNVHDIEQIIKCVNESVDDIAELGVYQGGTAEIICKHKGDRHLHLFDTFTGIPKPQPEDKSNYFESDYACQSFKVEELLKDYSNVFFHKGYFPYTTKDQSHLRFGFVHFDADLYQSCKDALEYFYPRLIKGGKMLIHDFHDGVEKAVRESLIPFEKLSTGQAIISKI